jgi:hypothetical protein
MCSRLINYLLLMLKDFISLIDQEDECPLNGNKQENVKVIYIYFIYQYVYIYIYIYIYIYMYMYI